MSLGARSPAPRSGPRPATSSRRRPTARPRPTARRPSAGHPSPIPRSGTRAAPLPRRRGSACPPPNGRFRGRLLPPGEDFTTAQGTSPPRTVKHQSPPVPRSEARSCRAAAPPVLRRKTHVPLRSSSHRSRAARHDSRSAAASSTPRRKAHALAAKRHPCSRAARRAPRGEAALRFHAARRTPRGEAAVLVPRAARRFREAAPLFRPPQGALSRREAAKPAATPVAPAPPGAGRHDAVVPSAAGAFCLWTPTRGTAGPERGSPRGQL